jgi:hypothetical protein
MMNSPFVVEQATATAERLLAKSDLSDDAARVDYAFRLVLGRPANSEQQAASITYLNDTAASLATSEKAEAKRLAAWTSLCQTLLASAEFRYVY